MSEPAGNARRGRLFAGACAIALGLVALKGVRSTASTGAAPERPLPIAVTLLAERPPTWLLAHVRPGGDLRFRGSNVPLGRIRAVTRQGRDALIVVDVAGHSSGDVLKVARTPLLIGEDLAVRGADYALDARVYALAPDAR